MDRRDFITGFSATTCASSSSLAQQIDHVKTIGFLIVASEQTYRQAIGLFLSEMARLGYIEGKNVRYVYRFADNYIDRLPKMADELVRIPCSVILAGPLQAIQAAKAATGSIPIVMTTTADPVGFGLVNSLANPGGNVTGSSNFAESLPQKQLQIFKELLPSTSRFAILLNETNPLHRVQHHNILKFIIGSGNDVLPVYISSPKSLELALNSILSLDVGGIIVPPDTMLQDFREHIAKFALMNNLPTVHAWRTDCEKGALMAYGIDTSQLWLQAARYVDKILSGEPPSKLPIWQPSKFDMCINLKTAQSMNIKIPYNILAAANFIIE